MKSLYPIFATFVVFPPLALGIVALKTLAQQPQRSVVKEHLEFCVSNLTVQVGQIEAIKGVMQQQNLPQLQKLEQVGQILTPAQKQQLLACMQQPMPPQGQ